MDRINQDKSMYWKYNKTLPCDYKAWFAWFRRVHNS